MNKKIIAATVVLGLATAVGGCKIGAPSKADGTQGVVKNVVIHNNDTMTLYVQMDADYGGKVETYDYVTSGHSADDCNIGTSWPKCLRTWK